MSGSSSKIRIHWRAYTRDSSVPSFRYRCLLPALGLADSGFAENRITKVGQDACLELGDEILILVKAISRADLKLVLQAKAFGIPVLLDLCDNPFFWPDYFSRQANTEQFFFHTEQVAVLREVLREVTAVVVPTNSLRTRLLEEVPGLRVVVIPDAHETEGMRNRVPAKRTTLLLTYRSYFDSPYVALKTGIAGIYFILQALILRAGKALASSIGSFFERLVVSPFSHLKQAYDSFLAGIWPGIDWKGLKRAQAVKVKPVSPPVWRPAPFIPAVPANLRRLVWFGNSGVEEVFGICELKKIEGALASLYQKMPFVLTVVAESDLLLTRYFSKPLFPMRFVRWSLQSCPRQIQDAEVVLLPNSDNDFARHKSANRAVLALSLGRPVVASSLASLEPLQECILFNDFESSVMQYLNSPQLVQTHVQSAQAIIEKEFSPTHTLQLWKNLINELTAKRLPVTVQTALVGATSFRE